MLPTLTRELLASRLGKVEFSLRCLIAVVGRWIIIRAAMVWPWLRSWIRKIRKCIGKGMPDLLGFLLGVLRGPLLLPAACF